MANENPRVRELPDVAGATTANFRIMLDPPADAPINDADDAGSAEIDAFFTDYIGANYAHTLQLNGPLDDTARDVLIGGVYAGITITRLALTGNPISIALGPKVELGSSDVASRLTVFGGSGAGRQTITGSRSDGSALLSLLTALHNWGFITDGTSA